MSTASASKVDAVFGRWLDASELSSFHEKLLSNMTLQNVIRSITILDPERLFHEIESAVHELQRRTGEKIGSNAIIGLYVHLCCLVERLVTRNPLETYVGQDRFEEERADFIESFRQSFSSISTRYRVEVPRKRDRICLRLHKRERRPGARRAPSAPRTSCSTSDLPRAAAS